VPPANTRPVVNGSRLYLGTVIVVGLTVAGLATIDVFISNPQRDWLILAALTLLSGSFTIKIPGLLARLSVSDAFVFSSVLLFGPSVATVIVAIDSLVATLWMRPEHRSLLRSLFNVGTVALAIWTSSHTFFWLANATPGEPLNLSGLVGPLFVLAAFYFLINSWLVAFALGFERNTDVLALWWKNFPWFSLNYFGGVSVAALLVSQTRSIDLTAVGIILPLLAISYLTYRTSLGRVEDAERHVGQVNELYISTIETLAMAVDAKDQITHGHIRRVQVYAIELAKRLGVSDDAQLKAIETAALLHDMGKLAIPEYILNKPGKLTPAEFDKMKRHADIGADLLSSIKFPFPVVPIVRHHHEHWNGQGYPTGISQADIPLGARILSVVDCFDALNSDRPYRPRLSPEDAFTILRERRGTMYDPLVVDTFIRAYSDIAPLAIRAGQEAKSIIPVGLLEVNEQSGADSLQHIGASASESALLTTVRRDLSKASSSQHAISIAANGLRQLTAATIFAFYRYNQTADELCCEIAIGDHAHLLEGLTIQLGERVSGWTAATRQTSINSEAVLDLTSIATAFAPPLRSTASVPVARGENLVGVFTAYATRVDGFEESHRYAIEEIASALFDALASFGPDSQRPDRVIRFPHQQS
jgi:putative nucleotidyltransferase with HDIG domain